MTNIEGALNEEKAERKEEEKAERNQEKEALENKF